MSRCPDFKKWISSTCRASGGKNVQYNLWLPGSLGTGGTSPAKVLPEAGCVSDSSIMFSYQWVQHRLGRCLAASHPQPDSCRLPLISGCYCMLTLTFLKPNICLMYGNMIVYGIWKCFIKMSLFKWYTHTWGSQRGNISIPLTANLGGKRGTSQGAITPLLPPWPAYRAGTGT